MKSIAVPVGRTSRMISTLLMVLVLILPVTHIRSALAQVSDDGFTDANTYESLFGYVLTWDDPWILDEEGSGFITENLIDSLYFTQDDVDTDLSVTARPSVGSLRSGLDFTAEYFGQSLPDSELLEIESTKQEGRAVIRYDLDGDAHAAYIRMFLSEDRSTEMTIVIAGELAPFDEILDTAQETIEIDAAPSFGDVDSGDLLQLLQDGDSIPFPTPSGGNGDMEDEANPPANDDKKLPDDDEGVDPTPTDEDEEDVDPTPADEEEDVDPTPTEEDEEDIDSTPADDEGDAPETDLADLGLIEEGVYESPQFGVELEWTSDWTLDTDTFSSDEAQGIDKLTLLNSDVNATFYLSSFSLDELTADAWVESFVSLVDDDFLGLEILDQRTDDGAEVILYTYETDGEPQYGLIEVREDEANDALVVVEVSGSEDEVADAFEVVQDTIELDGDAPFVATLEFPEIPASDD